MWNVTIGPFFLLSPSPLSKSFPVFQLPLLIILLRPVLGLSLLHCPWGFPFETIFSLAEVFFLSLCPIHYHFFSLTWIATDFSCAHLHVSSFEVTSYQKIFKIFQRYLFIIGNTVECPCIVPDFHASLLSHLTSRFSNTLSINSVLNFFYFRFSTANLQNHCTKLNRRWSLECVIDSNFSGCSRYFTLPTAEYGTL